MEVEQTLDDFTKAYIEAMLWAESAELGECDNEECTAVDREHVLTDQDGKCMNCGGKVWATDRSFQDCGFDAEMIAPESLARIIADCTRFQTENAAHLVSENCLTRLTVSEQAGHDFWLTRGHHGCGFWETSDWEESAGELLTDSAHAFGECHVYIGESDGKVHIQ